MNKKAVVPSVLAFVGAGLLLIAFTRMRSLITGAPDPLMGKLTASEYESSWFDLIETAQNDICNVVAEPKHAQASKVIVNRTLHLTSVSSSYRWETYDTFSPTPFNQSDTFMSKMHYDRVCYNPKSETFERAPGKGVQLIEPLWGMLRDPFDVYCKEKALSMHGHAEQNGQSKAHIMPQGYAPYAYSLTDEEPDDESLWRSHGLPPWHSSLRPSKDPQMGVAYRFPQNIHLDLGSAYFGQWDANGGAAGGAASGQWFYNMYHARGQPFNRFIAVEVEALDPKTAFDQLPEDLVGVYTLMNVGLTMGQGDKLDTVEMIKRVVKEEDFFVFKLDIDSAPIEEPIVKSLLEDDPHNGGASALVDELVCLRLSYYNFAITNLQ
ncbi:MAG: hypothetical protein Q9222_004526 [Ikaeria aurantiellina]